MNLTKMSQPSQDLSTNARSAGKNAQLTDVI